MCTCACVSSTRQTDTVKMTCYINQILSECLHMGIGETESVTGVRGDVLDVRRKERGREYV